MEGVEVERLLEHGGTESYYMQIANKLKEELREGSFSADQRICTQKELCARFGVSHITVNKALDQLVSEGLLYRRRGKGTFLAEPRKRQQTSVIGLVVNNVANPFFAELTRAVQRRAVAEGYDLTLYDNSNFLEESKSIEMLVRRNVDGVLLVPSMNSAEEGLIRGLNDAGIPFVYLNRALAGPQADRVVLDNAAGTTMAMDYLFSLGHTRIGFVAAAPFTSVIEERLATFKGFMASRHLSGDEFVEISGLVNEHGGRDAGRTLLAARHRPTAVFCANDITAAGFMKAARDSGVGIPRELSVVGFDDIDMAKHLLPPLTTVRQPLREMAETATEILIRRITEKRGEEAEVLVAPTLVVRESTMAAK